MDVEAHLDNVFSELPAAIAEDTKRARDTSGQN